MKKQFFSFVIWLSWTGCVVATNPKVDSLLNLEVAGREDTSHVDVLNQLSWELHRTDIQLSKSYAAEARLLAQNINYPKGLARSLNLLAISISNEGKIMTAIDLNEQGLKIAEAIPDTFLISATTNDLAISFASLGNHEKALSYYQRSLDMSESNGDTLGIAFTLGNIGILHNSIGNKKQAREYLLRATKAAGKSSDPMVLVFSETGLGNFYEDQEDHQQALKHYQQGLEIASRAKDKWSMAILKCSMGCVHYKMANTEIGRQYCDEAIGIAKELGDITLQATLWLETAKLYSDLQHTDQGIRAAEEALDIATTTRQIKLMPDILITLGQLHRQNHEHELAYHYNNQYIQFKDSLRTEQQALRIAELEQLYQSKQQAAQNKLLLAEQDKNKAIIARQKLMVIAIAIIFVLLLALLYILYRVMQNKSATQAILKSKVTERTIDLENKTKELKATVAELERFNYVASHDIKEPMRVVGGLSGMIHRRLPESLQQKFAEDFRLINVNLIQLYDLLEDISALGRIKREAAILDPIDLDQLLSTVTTLLSELIDRQKVVIESKELPRINSNSSLLFIILKNLIENGIKYNESPVPRIKIRYHKLEGYHRIEVEDNGIGIERAYSSKIFDMFTRLHERGKSGSGIGLALVKTAVIKLGGFIQLESKTGKGSTFFVYLPLKEVLTPEPVYQPQ